MIPRTEFTFVRTICACAACKSNCRHLSGMIAPWDLLRWRAEMGATADVWLRQSLAASPGALVMLAGQGERIHTLVPVRLAGGRCRFLSAQERCTIHGTAPFGCAFFDCTMTKAQGDRRSEVALAAIAYDWATAGPYSCLWQTLAAAGQTVAAPEQGRATIVRSHGKDV